MTNVYIVWDAAIDDVGGCDVAGVFATEESVRHLAKAHRDGGWWVSEERLRG